MKDNTIPLSLAALLVLAPGSLHAQAREATPEEEEESPALQVPARESTPPNDNTSVRDQAVPGQERSAPESGPSKRALTDEQIAGVVRQELRYDIPNSPSTVKVEVNEGVVTLAGSVPDLRRRELAEEIAGMLRGVRGVENELRVEPGRTIEAGVLSGQLENAFATDSLLGVRHIRADVDGKGAVTLTGEVATVAERDYAQRLARSLTGVTSVTNELRLAKSSQSPVDEELERDIKAQMRWNTGIDDALVDVEVSGGVAKLSGMVGSAVERRRATEIARRISGVEQIDSSGLQVGKWSRDKSLRGTKYTKVSDSELAEAMQGALNRAVGAQAEAIELEVADGIVRLHGSAPTLRAKRVAEQVAGETVGVREIRNEIEVANSAQKLPDEALEKIISNAFEWDSLFETSSISVEVETGVAQLTGEVPTIDMKFHAAEVASRPQGISEVVNELEVANPELVVIEASPKSTLAQRITDQFYWNSFVNGEHIDIELGEEGLVTLRGQVDTTQERDLAAQLTRRAGASRIRNLIVVR